LRQIVKSFVVVVAVFSIAGCSRAYQFEGIVVDGDGIPIQDATIIVYPHGDDRPSYDQVDGTSEETGRFEATWGLAPGINFFQMIVSADGYRPNKRIVEADANDLRIVMERIRSDEEKSKSNEDHDLK